MADQKRRDSVFTDRSLDRRTYLKGAGVAAGSVGLLGASSHSVTAEEYDVIEVGPGETYRKNIEDGETWENVLIDVTAQGAGYDISTGNSRNGSSNWTIRNIGIRGEFDNGSSSPFRVHDPDPNGESVIENVYLGDGAADSFQWNTHQVTGIFVRPEHAGDIEIRNVYINEFRDNAFYASPPGNTSSHPVPGGQGTVRIHDSYARNGGFNFRLGTEGSYCDNCISVIDESYNTGGPRCFYDYYSHGLEFRNCDAEGYGNFIGWSNGSTAWDNSFSCDTLRLENCEANVNQLVGGACPGQWTGEEPGSNPRSDPAELDGLPLSPEEAASGEASGSAGSSPSQPDEDDEADEELDHSILVDGVGTSGTSRYEFTVSGEVEKSTYKGATIDEEDVVESGRVTGAVAGWRDAFRFSGELEELTVDGPARVVLDGERVDPTEYGEEFPHVLTIVGNGSEATYEALVDGEFGTVGGESADGVELISDTEATGSIERGVQRLHFSGELVGFEFTEGCTQAYLDSDRIDPDDYDADRALPPHAIVIDGSDADGPSTYSFTIDGEIVQSSFRDATRNDEAEIDGSTVRGTVENELDAYWFDGDIAAFRLAGEASIDIQYDAREQ